MSPPSLQAIEAGKCVLFLGAGFSREATNIAGEKIVGVQGLQQKLLTACGIDNSADYDLETAAEEYVDRFGDERLITLLHGSFTTAALTNEQRLVVSQPWWRIYTTNYDDSVERAAQEVNKPITVREPSDPVEAPLAGRSQLIHIYGNIRRASPVEFKNHFLLTERQRDNSPFLNSAWRWRFHRRCSGGASTHLRRLFAQRHRSATAPWSTSGPSEAENILR